MKNVWVIERLRRGGFRCYEVTTHDDGSFEVGKPVVLQNALLFLDGECIELAEQAQQPKQSGDPTPSCSSDIDTSDDAEPQGPTVSLTSPCCTDGRPYV